MQSVSPATLRLLRAAVRNELSSAPRAEAGLRARPQSCSRITTATSRTSTFYTQRYYSVTRQRQAQATHGAASADGDAPTAARAARGAPQNYYELFPKSLPQGPPPQGPFPIDLKTLRNEFLQLQAKAHPDLHSGEDKRRAEATSALINEAYNTLQDPLKRAQYLLSLRGYETDKDEAAKLGGDVAGDHELLMTVMDVNETVEGATEQAEIDGLKFENDERIAASVAELGELFKADRLEVAQKEAIRLRYWMNIKQSLHEWEPGKPVVLVH